MSAPSTATSTLPKAVRVMLVDDHQVVREAIVRMLSRVPGIELVAQCGDAREALAALASAAPHVAVVDLTLPGIPGCEAIPRLRARAPQLHVLVNSMHHDRAHVREALNAGAHGFVSKQAPGSALAHAIKAVAAGFCHVNLPSEATAFGRPRASAPPPHGGVALSDREAEVLRMVALGYTHREIADELGLSTASVDACRTRTLQRLGLEHRKQVVLFALRHGLLE